jgi:hypothetical protein
MAVAARFTQSPTASLDYLIDWTAWLTSPPDPGDTITNNVWSADTGITIVDLGHTTTGARVRVSGGIVPNTYNVVSTITTAFGNTDERTLAFLIREL